MRKFGSRSSKGGDREPAHNLTLGRSGESLVAEWYRVRGYDVLERNWRRREGEIDLILRSATDLVFCEVKSRTSTAFGLPSEAVTPAKRLRIRKLAVLYLASGKAPHTDHLRFDVASVLGDEVTVITNAF